MGFFSRLINLIRGWLGLKVSQLEESNPAAVYENAIRERVEKQKELKSAVAGIVQLRNKTENELKGKEQKLLEFSAQLEVAIDEGEDEAAMALIEMRDELTPQIESLEADLDNIKRQAEQSMTALNNFREDIKKLKREKEEMLAKVKTAEARIKIQESLDGLSVDADTQALENVRTHIHKKVAEADVGSELQENSVDAALDRIKAKTGNARARSELERMKKLRAAKKEGAKNLNLKRTI